MKNSLFTFCKRLQKSGYKFSKEDKDVILYYKEEEYGSLVCYISFEWNFKIAQIDTQLGCYFNSNSDKYMSEEIFSTLYLGQSLEMLWERLLNYKPKENNKVQVSVAYTKIISESELKNFEGTLPLNSILKVEEIE